MKKTTREAIRWCTFVVQVLLFIVLMMNWAKGAACCKVARQEAVQGPVTIYTLDGNVWGYFGDVTVTCNEYGEMDVEMHNAWLVGSTHPDYCPAEPTQP